MNVGERVTHKVDGRTLIILEKGKFFTCRYYNLITGRYIKEEFIPGELTPCTKKYVELK